MWSKTDGDGSGRTNNPSSFLVFLFGLLYCNQYSYFVWCSSCVEQLHGLYFSDVHPLIEKREKLIIKKSPFFPLYYWWRRAVLSAHSRCNRKVGMRVYIANQWMHPCAIVACNNFQQQSCAQHSFHAFLVVKSLSASAPCSRRAACLALRSNGNRETNQATKERIFPHHRTNVLMDTALHPHVRSSASRMLTELECCCSYFQSSSSSSSSSSSLRCHYEWGGYDF